MKREKKIKGWNWKKKLKTILNKKKIKRMKIKFVW